MKRARDEKGHFVRRDDLIPVKDAFSDAPASEPTAADLDKHQAEVESENKAREATWNPPPGYSLKDAPSFSAGDEVPVHGLPGVQSQESVEYIGPPPYGSIALFAASMAILAVLGTLWAVYYVVRPKLDKLGTVITAAPVAISYAEICPANQTCLIVAPARVDPHPQTLKIEDPIIQNVPPSESFPTTAPLPLKDQVLGGGINLVHGLLTLIADEDVWIRVTAISKKERVSIFEGSVKKWWKESYIIAPGINFEIRSGKPGAVSVYIDAKQITPENKYHGGGNLAEYVLDGKELLAGK